MQDFNCQHTFAVCAYGQSPYLRDCLDSLKAQEGCKSEIYIATSTPSVWLNELAAEYDLPVYVNSGESGIGQDWNFAYLQAATPFVTIAHQDDTYCSGYAAAAVESLSADEHSLIFFSDYGELRNDERVDTNQLLEVKRKLLKPPDANWTDWRQATPYSKSDSAETFANHRPCA